MEGPYALRPRLLRGNAINAAVRLPQAAGARDAGGHARAELHGVTAEAAPYVSSLRKSGGVVRYGFETPDCACSGGQG